MVNMKISTKCECGAIMKKTAVDVISGIKSEAYRCTDCDELEFTEEQARNMLQKKEKRLT